MTAYKVSYTSKNLTPRTTVVMAESFEKAKEEAWLLTDVLNVNDIHEVNENGKPVYGNQPGQYESVWFSGISFEAETPKAILCRSKSDGFQTWLPKQGILEVNRPAGKIRLASWLAHKVKFEKGEYLARLRFEQMAGQEVAL